MQEDEQLVETIKDSVAWLRETESSEKTLRQFHVHSFLYGYARGCLSSIDDYARKITYSSCDWCHGRFPVSRLSSWGNEWQHLCPGCYYCAGCGAPILMKERDEEARSA